MKIALLGNTCNNNFSIMRYFRTLGADAHLLLYSDEGLTDSNPIHNPEWDTWNIGCWSPYIHRLPIPNGIQGVVGRPDLFIRRPKKTELEKIFYGYDYYIGSGISPALFSRMNRALSIFYPYATGIEWVSDGQTLRKFSKYNLEWPFRWYVRKLQIAGIQKAEITVNPLLDHTKDVLDRYGIGFIRKYVPQVYNLEVMPSDIDDDLLQNLMTQLGDSNYRIFSHMRHHWVGQENIYDIGTWWRNCKHNDWLIRGFSKFISINKNVRAKLILVDWGKDAGSSRVLCTQLGLNDNIIWLPLLKRRQIYWILSHCCDLAIGEFVQSPGAIWGSTGWETIAAGVPTMQTINFDEITYRNIFGHSLPKLIDVKSLDDVFINLCKVYSDISFARESARCNRKWFSEHSGLELAKDWLHLMKPIAVGESPINAESALSFKT